MESKEMMEKIMDLENDVICFMRKLQRNYLETFTFLRLSDILRSEKIVSEAKIHIPLNEIHSKEYLRIMESIEFQKKNPS